MTEGGRQIGPAQDDEREPWPLLYFRASGREFEIFFNYYSFESNNREKKQTMALRCNARSQNKTGTETSARHEPVLLTAAIYLWFCFFFN